jgi:hypothetical protein
MDDAENIHVVTPGGSAPMVGYIAWAVLLAGMLVVEGIGLVVGGRDWPTVSDMFRAVTRPVAGRWLFFALWLWAGWHFFIRGWQFFLRGRSAENPGNPTAGKPFGSTIAHVILPLLAFYLMLGSALLLGRREAKDRLPRQKPVRADPRLVYRRPRQFVQYVVVTIVAGYVIFAGAIWLYQATVDRGAGDLSRSAIEYGAFLAFAIALPVFILLSLAEAFLRSRVLTSSRGRFPAGTAPSTPPRRSPHR